MPQLEALDVMLVLLLVLGALSGFRQGAIAQAFGLVGAGVAAIGAVALLPDVAASIPITDRILRSVLVLGFLLVALAFGQAVGEMIALGVLRRMGRGPLETLDRVAGAGIGVAQVVLVIWFLAPILAVGPSPVLAQQIDQSVVIGTVRGSLPPPGPVLGRLRAFLDPAGLPQVFQLFETPFGSPVPTPRDAQVAALGEAAAPSIVAVVGDACGLQLTGTGFAIAPGYFLTNAHVVAGERSGTQVVTDSGGSADATVVFYDPAMDVALLYAPDMNTPPLALASTDPATGSIGVALGHPGGGPLAMVPAAVRDVFTATGYDIYGRTSVTRVVVELAADVQSGDSGGPFVTTDGTVSGLVFARARTSGAIGYALEIGEVRADVSGSLGSTAPVGTGDCAP